MFNLPSSVKGNRLQIVKNVFPAMRGVYKALKDPKTDNEWGKLFVEMRKNGGTTGWYKLHNIDDITQQLKNLSNELNGKMAPTQKFKKLLGYVADINEAVENSARLVAYKMARESGHSVEKSSSVAKNLTVNFNRKGERGTEMNALYMFYNASVQGSATMMKALVKNKRLKYYVGGISVGAIGLDYINRSINEKAYKAIPKYIKDTNYIFMLPDGNHIKFPLPYGYNVFKGVGDIASNLYHKDIELKDVPKRMLSLIIHTISPTLIKPAVEIEKANEYSGGTMHKSGWADVSPETLEHLASFATGGLGKLIMNSVTVANQAIDKDEKVDINKMPFLNKFYAVPREKAELQHLYKMLTEI